MWSKIFILALAVIPFQAPAHEGEPSPPYEVKDATRFYRVDSADKPNKRGVWISFVVPKGFTLGGCNGMPEIFLDGMECFQDEFPVLRKVLEKNGVKRAVEIGLSGGKVDTNLHPEYKTVEGRIRAARSSALWKHNVTDEILSQGEFHGLNGVAGHFARKSMGPATSKDPEFYKEVMRDDPPCSHRGVYREKSSDGASYVHPKDWLFEDVFDEVVRSMRCELISDIDLRKIRKSQETREKKKK